MAAEELPRTTILINSITTNEPNILPKSRIHNDTGRINNSKILIGTIKAMGSAKPFIQPFPPF